MNPGPVTITVGEACWTRLLLTITVVESDLTVTPAVVLRRLELGGGTWTFSAASRTAGAPIAASFTSTLYLPL